MTDHEMLQQLLVKVNSIDETVTRTDSRVGNLETRMDKVETRMDNMEAKMDKAETRMDDMETVLRETRVCVESIPKLIQLIAEQHGVLVEKLDALADYPTTRERVATLEGSLQMVADRVKKLEAV